MKKLTRDHTALVKDLELQIDYLIGYAPSGNHWKQEYHIRKELIDATLSDEQTPKEIYDKITRIQNSLYELQNKETHDQEYIKASIFDYDKPHPPILVHHWTGDYLI